MLQGCSDTFLGGGAAGAALRELQCWVERAEISVHRGLVPGVLLGRERAEWHFQNMNSPGNFWGLILNLDPSREYFSIQASISLHDCFSAGIFLLSIYATGCFYLDHGLEMQAVC